MVLSRIVSMPLLYLMPWEGFIGSKLSIKFNVVGSFGLRTVVFGNGGRFRLSYTALRSLVRAPTTTAPGMQSHGVGGVATAASVRQGTVVVFVRII